METSGVVCLRLSATVFCAALLLAGEITLVSSFQSENANSSRPHSLYMKKLRDYLSFADIVLPKSKDVSDNELGSLVATSIETKSSKGKGYSDKGFSLEGTNKLELEFAIPRESNGKDFPNVELWIFPDKSTVEPNTVQEITFQTKVGIAEAIKPRHDQGIMLWDTRENCITINLTNLSKKIYRVLQKRNLNESNVSLIFEITRTRKRHITLENDPIRSLHHNFCSALSQRSTNDTFLIIKNFDEKASDVITDLKTSDPVHNVNELNRASPNDCCNRSSLLVNLTEIYGKFLKEPQNVNIWDCTGECTAASNCNLFTHHASVKERLKLLPKGEALSQFQPHCTPMMFKPYHVLFGVKVTSDVIVQLLDLVVEKCGCL